MKARNQTDPNLQQLSIIASRAEWMALIEALNFEEDDPMTDAWRQSLYDIVVKGENESRQDTRDFQDSPN